VRPTPLQKTRAKWTGELAQVVKYLISNPSPTKKNKQKKSARIVIDLIYKIMQKNSEPYSRNVDFVNLEKLGWDGIDTF
jgi:hypothetical protein